jgi:aminotransferase
MSNDEASSETPPLAQIANQLPFSGIRKFFDIAGQMQDVISLGVGEPDFATPWVMREAAIHSIERGRTSYTSNYGLLELRQQISNHLAGLYNVNYRPDDEILITVGVSEGMDLAMRTILNPGDEVIVPEPCYVAYKPCVSLAGGVPITLTTRAEDGFAFSVAQLEQVATERTKAILFGYPTNPTGATMSREALQDVVDYARKRNWYLVSDEIYDRLTYDSGHTCVASLPGAWERTITLYGFSKAYAMTGWRVGYACAPANILSVMMKIHSYTILCAPILGQFTAVEALKNGETAVQSMKAEYNQRRRFIVDGLNKLGLHCHMPTGAFYAFPNISNSGLSSNEFAEKLLFGEKVAVIPGTAFGASGEGFIRCSYATSLEKIEIALERMGAFLHKLNSNINLSAKPILK